MATGSTYKCAVATAIDAHQAWVSFFSPFPPLSECANNLYICIFQFAKCEKTFCLSVFWPFSLYTDIQILSVFQKRDLYICIKDVKSRFTNFNARLRPIRPNTIGGGGYKSHYRWFCMIPPTLKRPVYRHFTHYDTVIYRKYRKNGRKSGKQEKVYQNHFFARNIAHSARICVILQAYITFTA